MTESDDNHNMSDPDFLSKETRQAVGRVHLAFSGFMRLPGVKFIIIGILMALLMIPALLVWALVEERAVRASDVAVAFSTSGRSPNVVRGLAAARRAGATTVLFGGGDGGPAAGHADHALLVPSGSTARIQELHVLFLHIVIEHVDRWAAGE